MLESNRLKEAANKEFEEFFGNCKGKNFNETELQSIFGIIMKKEKTRFTLKKVIFSISMVYAIYLLIIKCDCVAWPLSAIGRLLLIQVLPYWDWTALYSSRCLVPKSLVAQINGDPIKGSTKKDQNYEADEENCALCEGIDYIPALENITFSFLEATYLERGIPVIVIDSHRKVPFEILLETMLSEAREFINSEPCDLATNLMLKKLFNLELAFNKIRNLNAADKWFLQLRNCRFSAVKASRHFMTRPYYYPVHLEPFYTSWLLMTNNFSHGIKRQLYTKGLIIVQQLSGTYKIHLDPKTPCDKGCPSLRMQLNPGEGLIFSTDLWKFAYETLTTNVTSIATILEINWNL